MTNRKYYDINSILSEEQVRSYPKYGRGIIAERLCAYLIPNTIHAHIIETNCTENGPIYNISRHAPCFALFSLVISFSTAACDSEIQC